MDPEATFPALLDALATARSIHRYRSDPIPEQDLARILHSATRAPSGSNAQPFRFLVLRDGAEAQPARTLLGDSFRSSWSRKSSNEGWRKGSGAKPDSPKARTARVMQRFVDGANSQRRRAADRPPVPANRYASPHRQPRPPADARVRVRCGVDPDRP